MGERTVLRALGFILLASSCAQGTAFDETPSTSGDATGGEAGSANSSSSSGSSTTSSSASSSSSSSSGATGGAGGMGGGGSMGSGAGAGGGASSSSSGASSSSSGGDPCAGVTCTTPPGATCLDAMTRQTYSATGTCVDGACMYAAMSTPCAANEACSNGECQAAGCVMPVEACQDGNQSRAGCSNARVMGRISASSASGFFISANTCSASNNSEGPNSGSCWDYGRDHSYRMFMRANETADISIVHGSKCANATSWDTVFKVYAGTGCLDKSCATKEKCVSFSTGTLTQSFTAPADGWYVFVIDGRTATNVYDDSGTYSLTVKLTCAQGGCGC